MMPKDFDIHERPEMPKTSRSIDRARRLTRADWIRAARQVLVQSGIDDPKVDRLARQMKVTRGGFYWHFKGFQDLADSLLHDWESRNQAEISEIRIRWSRSAPSLVDVFAIWSEEQPDFLAFDMAIRVWARKSKSVAEAARRVDDSWVELLKAIFLTEGYGQTDSFVRARVTYFTQIGYYALAIEEDLATRMSLAPAYYRALVGKEPDERLQELIQRQSSSSARNGARRIARRAKLAG